MIKKNKGKLIASSAVILLPLLLGLIFDDKLPSIMSSYWGVDGYIEGSGDFGLIFFILPVILLALHWIAVLISSRDPKNAGQNKKIFDLVIWLLPIISLFVSCLIFVGMSGNNAFAEKSVFLILGLLFAVIGNYLPKCKQNTTIGIKIKWTLENEENWNATHRFGGKIWFAVGIAILLCVFLPLKAGFTAMMIVTLGSLIVITLYSYLYYKKQVADGRVEAGVIPEKSENKRRTLLGSIVTAVILVFTLVIVFFGDVKVTYDENSFTVETAVWSELTIEYEAIDKLEYREEKVSAGTRTVGFAGARVLVGSFLNDEFGSYIRYSYVGCDECIVISADDKLLVISGENSESTKEIYSELLKRSQIG